MRRMTIRNEEEAITTESLHRPQIVGTVIDRIAVVITIAEGTVAHQVVVPRDVHRTVHRVTIIGHATGLAIEGVAQPDEARVLEVADEAAAKEVVDARLLENEARNEDILMYRAPRVVVKNLTTTIIDDLQHQRWTQNNSQHHRLTNSLSNNKVNM